MKKFLLIPFLLMLLACKKEQPAGICLSFDDRSIEEWYNIRSLLNEYGAKVTFFVTQMDSLTPCEIDKLKALERDGHEIGSHGALHVISEHYIKEYSYADYLQDEINPSIQAMKSAGFEIKSFAYPYGATYWFTDLLLLSKFEKLRKVTPLNPEKDLSLLDEIYYDFDNDGTVSAIGIDANAEVSRAMIREAMRRALDNQEVLMMYGHRPMQNPEPGSFDLNISLLRFILAEAERHQLKFYRMKDLK